MLFRSKDRELGIIMGVAMITNLLVAALAGVIIPLIQKRVGIDPAIAGGVVLTTVTDVIGFLTFLGLAPLFLLTCPPPPASPCRSCITAPYVSQPTWLSSPQKTVTVFIAAGNVVLSILILCRTRVN